MGRSTELERQDILDELYCKQAKLEIKMVGPFVLHPVHERIPTYAYYKDALHFLISLVGWV